MKTTIIIFFLMLVITGSAQPALKYMTFNAPDVRQFADSVALNAQEPYRFGFQGVSPDNRTMYEVDYRSVADSLISIVVQFRIHMVGGTDDVENPGSPQYVFEKITGRFNDIFPFWSKFMHPEADVMVVRDKGKDEAIVRGATYDFLKGATDWTIVKF